MMATDLGLRDRKKAETQRVLAEAALRLFAERGFDAVTVADIAAEVNVSAKTVFNYFPTKEDLVLRGGEEHDGSLLLAIESRAAGESILDAARRHTLETFRRMREVPAARRDAFRKVLQSAPSVQARWRERQRAFEQVVAGVLARETEAPNDDPFPYVAAGLLSHLGRLAYYDVIGWPDGRRRSAQKTEEAIEDAFARIAEGFGSYGVRPKKR
ncbi:MAG: TetR family transcriptional regulator [Polyangiaceae bacterium]|nr:TetR family transcriptional regulator [Polyangiaceae bacterium]